MINQSPNFLEKYFSFNSIESILFFYFFKINQFSLVVSFVDVKILLEAFGIDGKWDLLSLYSLGIICLDAHPK